MTVAEKVRGPRCRAGSTPISRERPGALTAWVECVAVLARVKAQVRARVPAPAAGAVVPVAVNDSRIPYQVPLGFIRFRWIGRGPPLPSPG